MKLSELLINQKLIVQILWGEQKIEFPSEVLSRSGESALITPYLHNGSALELNVTTGRGIVCNIFTDEPVTRKRISWKSVELTTVSFEGNPCYCIKTFGFNSVSNQDDRRHNERFVIDEPGQLYDGDTVVNVTIHDVSDVGVSFYVPTSFTPKSQEFTVTFTDNVGDRVFDVKVHCAVSRTVNNDGTTTCGCRLVGDNKDYLVYALIKRLREKNKGRM